MLLKFQPKKDHVKMVVLSKSGNSVPKRSMIQLLPGINEVTDDEWACMKGNLSSEIERKEIVTLEQKVKGKTVSNLKGLPSTTAIRYVSDCENPESLIKWYKEETREEVRLAITEKMNEYGVEKPKLDLASEDSEEEDSEEDSEK